jgi:hypothetical protein
MAMKPCCLDPIPTWINQKTLLTKVHNNILQSMSQGKMLVLVLLDLSAVFDTIDHKILLNRLESKHAISEKALDNLVSERTQSVIIGNSNQMQLL